MSRNRLGVASCAWVALMGIVWALFVPGRLSVGTFTLLSLSGPLLLTAAWMLQSANPPAPSVRQVRVDPSPRETDA